MIVEGGLSIAIFEKMRIIHFLFEKPLAFYVLSC